MERGSIRSFFIGGTSIGCSFGVTKVGEGYKVDTKHLKGKCNVDVAHHNVLEVETSDFVNNIEIETWDELILLSLDSCLGYAKAFCPSLVATVDLVSVNLPRLEKKIEEFKSLLENKEPRVEEVKQEKQKGKRHCVQAQFFKRLRWYFNIHQ